MCTDAEGPAPTHCSIRPGSPTNVPARPKPWDWSQTPILSLFPCPVSYGEDLHPESRVIQAKAMSLSGIIAVWRPH